MTRQPQTRISKLTLDNTKHNAIQNSHSDRTLPCDTEIHVSPGASDPSPDGQTRQDGSGTDELPSTSHAPPDTGDRETNHDPKIKFSGGTKESDQPLSRTEWQRRATAAKKRDEACGKQDPDGPDLSETGEMRSEWWDEWQEEKRRAKKERAKEIRAMLEASAGGESSQGSEKLRGSDGMRFGKLSEKLNGSKAARRTRASSIELALKQREKPVEPSSGHSSAGSETSEHPGTVLPSESGEEEIGRSTLYPDNAKQKLRRGRRFS